MMTNVHALPTSAGVFAVCRAERARRLDRLRLEVLRHHRVAVLDEMPHHRLAHPSGADDADRFLVRHDAFSLPRFAAHVSVAATDKTSTRRKHADQSARLRRVLSAGWRSALRLAARPQRLRNPPTRTSRSTSWSASRRAGRPTSSAAWSAPRWARSWARSSSSRTRPAPAAPSRPRTWRARRRTATRCSTRRSRPSPTSSSPNPSSTNTARTSSRSARRPRPPTSWW